MILTKIDQHISGMTVVIVSKLKQILRYSFEQKHINVVQPNELLPPWEDTDSL